jgi:uncharacterized membrane protein YbhN (UPF0104 family)
MNGMNVSRHKRWLWMAAKWAVTLLVLVMIGRVFYRDWRQLKDGPITWEPLWLAAAAGLYLIAIAFSWGFWHWALLVFDQKPDWFRSLRAYYIGHLGKYVPGKAFVLIMRTGMVQGPRVRTSVAALVTIYETITYIAAGALLGAILLLADYLFGPPVYEGETFLALAVLLVPVAVGPTIPWVFNPVMRRLAAPFLKADAVPLPRFRYGMLLAGMLWSLGSWLFMGVSLWATLRALQPGYPLELPELIRCTAYLCVATVFGFFTPLPGGLGIREVVLMALLLGSVQPQVVAFAAPVVLRLTWVVTEVLAAGVLYPWPLVSSREEPASKPRVAEPEDGSPSTRTLSP